MKMPYLLPHSLIDFLALVLCNVHNILGHTHWINNKSKQQFLKEEKSDFTFRTERARSPLCCHGNVTLAASWNFVTNIPTVQIFSSVKKVFRYNPFFFYFTSFWVHFVWCHKPSNLHESKSWITRQPRVLSPQNKRHSSSLWKLFRMS